MAVGARRGYEEDNISRKGDKMKKSTRWFLASWVTIFILAIFVYSVTSGWEYWVIGGLVLLYGVLTGMEGRTRRE